jgi:prepilin-type N-terminal cleavage/methylation domain-containing protein
MRMMTRSPQRGHSLIELLICVTIIGILMALYMPVLAKARRKAVQVAGGEAMRQKRIAKEADGANSVRPPSVDNLPDRDACRNAYLQILQTGKHEIFVTELLYAIDGEAEFAAYWHTLINPSASGPLEFDGGVLLAKDEVGTEFRLKALGAALPDSGPVLWDFLSTNMADTTMTGLGINVHYADGRTAFMKYPGAYPCCATVAELSRRFVIESG